MARFRSYKAGVFDTSAWSPTGAAVAGTSPAPVLYGKTSSGAGAMITAVRFGVLGASSFPPEASVAISLNIVTGSVAGGNAATATQTGGPAGSATTTFLTAGGTSAAALTGWTIGASLWSHVIPFTGGSGWETWVSPEFERGIGINTGFALVVTCSSAGTGTTFTGEIDFSE